MHPPGRISCYQRQIVEADPTWIPGRGDHASIHANQIDMCKSDHREDEGYRSVAAAIRKLAAIMNGEQSPVVSGYP